MLSLVKAGLAVGCAVIVAGCAAQEKTGPTAKAPDVTVSCIGVLPVRPAADMDEPMTGAESKNLQDGAAILDALLKESLRNRKDVRFLSAQQVEAVMGAEEPAGLEDSRSLAGQVSCNVLLETTISRYVNRVGGQYGVNKRVTQAHIGGIWNPIKPVDIGLEYIWGKRETLLGEKGDMSRINFLARYNLN